VLTQLTGLVHLAVTGGPQGVTGSVSGMTLQQFCNTGLCDIISVAEFSQAVGGGVTTVHKTSMKLPSGAVQVNCAYLPQQIPGPGGGIFFVITSNTSDAKAYYDNLQKEEQCGLNGLHTLTGLGDAAYWGTDTTAPDILSLTMRKDNVVVGITMDGPVVDGSIFLPGAEQMAKEIASRL